MPLRAFAPLGLLAVLAASPAAAEGPIDPTCAFSNRYPVTIVVPGANAVASLEALGIDIDGVALPEGPSLAGTVRAYVNDAERGELLDLGLTVSRVRNEAKEQFLRVREEWAARAGQPIEPVLAGWPTYPELEAELQQVAAQHPDIVRVVQMGTTVQGRAIWMVRITDQPDVEESEPEFKFTSSIHGDEVVGMDLCRRMIHYLVDNYGIDPAITQLINGTELWFCPMHNPDGYVNGTRYNAHGRDINRSFPDPVTDPHDDPTGREPEVQAFMYFGYAHSFILSANYHGGELVMNIPWDCKLEETPDHDMIWSFAEGYSFRNPPMWNSSEFYHGVTLGSEWYIIHGGMQDWCYEWRNEIDITIEVGTTKWPSYPAMETFWAQNRDSMLYYMQRTGVGVHGRVTDLVTGAPLAAQVDVREIGKIIRTDPAVGDYHRMLSPGTYTITFTALGYTPKTISGVTVVGETPTMLDVSMQPLNVDVAEQATSGALGLETRSANPARTGAPIELLLSAPPARPVVVTVHDALGRQVRSLFAGEVAGRAPLLWDGRDDRGLPSPAGLYWIRARQNAVERTARVVFVH